MLMHVRADEPDPRNNRCLYADRGIQGVPGFDVPDDCAERVEERKCWELHKPEYAA